MTKPTIEELERILACEDDPQRIEMLSNGEIRAVSDWQKMDTAPKDGTAILVWGGFHFWDGLSCPDEGCKADFVSMVNWKDDAWWSDEEHWREPRRWMAMPKPPAHDSDCAVHNEPATPNGPCDCSLSK